MRKCQEKQTKTFINLIACNEQFAIICNISPKLLTKFNTTVDLFTEQGKLMGKQFGELQSLLKKKVLLYFTLVTKFHQSSNILIATVKAQKERGLSVIIFL